MADVAHGAASWRGQGGAAAYVNMCDMQEKRVKK
jgi:hypothetical protein